LSLGLLKGTLKQALASEAYKRFYMHKTGHWIGLDVHDVGDYKLAGEFRELEPGMVFTIEPGVYASDIGGFRHSDTVVVTPDGIDVLTSYPKDIESLTIPV
jgi:Xaa-Pro aminopeptidase